MGGVLTFPPPIFADLINRNCCGGLVVRGVQMCREWRRGESFCEGKIKLL